MCRAWALVWRLQDYSLCPESQQAPEEAEPMHVEPAEDQALAFFGVGNWHTVDSRQNIESIIGKLTAT